MAEDEAVAVFTGSDGGVAVAEQPTDGAAAGPSMEELAAPAKLVDADELDLGYRVSLESFSGPLDLLLHLVRKAEVDITAVCLVAIADQFIATIEAWEDMDLDVAGDFILMAATLLEWKARTIVPPEEEDEEEDESDLFDPRADLIRQLLAYRRVKEAAQELGRLEQERQRCHARRWQETIPDDPDELAGMSLDNADPYQLFAAWQESLASIAAQAPRRVVYDDIPMEERMKQMHQLMAEAREARLSWMLERVETPVQRCGVIVALLECVRQCVVEATQYEQYGDVDLRYIDEGERRRESSPLPPEPEEEAGQGGKRKRRKRPPLFTFAEPEGHQDVVQEVITEVLEDLPVETEEQRFVRELNQQIGVDQLLDRVGQWEVHLDSRLREAGLLEEEPEEDAVPSSAPTDEPAEDDHLAQTDEDLVDRRPGDDGGSGAADDEDEFDDDEFDDEDDEDDFDDEDDEDED